MFSVDTIGGMTSEKEVFLVGSSVHSSLAGKSRKFLQRMGLREGKEIDRFAFTFGSDHYPFHEKGIPAIDFFAADYKKLHSLRDNVEAIDFEKLADVTRLIYLTVYEFLTEP
jgi:Zn-dependent M28 family amino/carboxypeptidase